MTQETIYLIMFAILIVMAMYVERKNKRLQKEADMYEDAINSMDKIIEREKEKLVDKLCKVTLEKQNLEESMNKLEKEIDSAFTWSSNNLSIGSQRYYRRVLKRIVNKRHSKQDLKKKSQ